MNDLLPDDKNILAGVVGALMAMLTWLGKRQVKRIDALEEAHKTMVSREELTQTITQFNNERQRMHDQNREDLQYIRERIDTIADR